MGIYESEYEELILSKFDVVDLESEPGKANALISSGEKISFIYSESKRIIVAPKFYGTKLFSHAAIAYGLPVLCAGEILSVLQAN